MGHLDIVQDEQIKTFFAPAERANPDELSHQVAMFSGNILLDSILDGVSSAVVVLNSKRQIVYANRYMVGLAGEKDRESLYGARLGEVLGCLHSCEMPGGCGTSETCATCGAVKAIQESLTVGTSIEECRISRSGNLVLDLRVWGRLILVNDERFTVLSAQDISSEKRRAVLEHVFFHDVMNTLSVISSISNLLNQENSNNKAENQVSVLLHQATNRLVDEIETHRELLRAETNEIAVAFTELDPNEVIQEILSFYLEHPCAAGKSLSACLHDEVFHFKSDRTLLLRILGNLLKNALEATLECGAVVIGWERTSSEVKFWVKNSEVIPRDAQLQIFQRSFSTKGKGRGVGTYSVKLFAEKYLGGKATFQSEPDLGTIFFVALPFSGTSSISA